MAQLGNTIITGSLSVTNTVNLVCSLGIASGGTGATTAEQARTNLGLGTAATYACTCFRASTWSPSCVECTRYVYLDTFTTSADRPVMIACSRGGTGYSDQGVSTKCSLTFNPATGELCAKAFCGTVSNATCFGGCTYEQAKSDFQGGFIIYNACNEGYLAIYNPSTNSCIGKASSVSINENNYLIVNSGICTVGDFYSEKCYRQGCNILGGICYCYYAEPTIWWEEYMADATTNCYVLQPYKMAKFKKGYDNCCSEISLRNNCGAVLIKCKNNNLQIGETVTVSNCEVRAPVFCAEILCAKTAICIPNQAKTCWYQLYIS